ncbi:rhamnogalacturonan acetylesterase [Pedobacter aquae]|uniref:Rhamnogalacturonan acetylesterase n=1 Tax=Pedobacter aquae TaxID=2605747 RepID=A0A5C0VI80_9SPHI|nr:rhamnogalacturonan acetylesterase [Pedobacter aquae]QEK51391.1 rhamnogalacturonan acetylesterase [Pedobacter aquae]
MRILSFLLLAFTFSGSLQAQQAARPSYKFDFGKADLGAEYKNIKQGDKYSKASVFGFDFETQPTFSEVKKGAYDVVSSDKVFYFSVNLPEGNYEVKVLLANPHGDALSTVKAESRRLMLKDVKIPKGKYKYESFIVNIKDRNITPDKKVALKERELTKLDWDDKLTIEFNGKTSLAALEITPVDDQITVYLAGNSTVVNQDTEPWAAWGQMIPYFFKPGVAIANHAESGLTLGSFLGSKRLDKILSVIKPGDYLFIEFGHNDQKDKGPDDGAYKSYTERLKLFVNSARSKNAIPIILTSTSRRSFNKEGKVVETLGDFPDAARKVAQALNVPLIDLNKATKILYEALGEEESKKALVHYAANTYPGQTQAIADNTHFSTYGAFQIAKIIVKEIMQQDIRLKKYIKNFKNYYPAKPDDPATWIWPLSLRNDLVKPDGN